jgi:hypothetical protein
VQFSINSPPKTSRCRRRRSRATEYGMMMSSLRSSSPLEKSVGRTSVSSSCWLSRDSGATRSPVYSGKSWISPNECGELPRSRTKNAKAHVVHLSQQSVAVLTRADQRGPYVFSLLGMKPFQEFSRAKRRLDQLSGVTGWRFTICAGPAFPAWRA